MNFCRVIKAVLAATSRVSCCAVLTVMVAGPGLAAPEDRLQTFITAEFEKAHTPGASVAVIDNDRTAIRAVYGFASLELNVPVSETTTFQLASMSKEFTAVGVVRLAEKGLLSLDDPISKHLVGLPEAWRGVTLRQALSHTSGLPDILTDDLNLFLVAPTWEEALPILAQRPTQAAGQASSYNQTGYILLGKVIERVTGLDFENFIRQELFEPLGLRAAVYGDAWDIIKGRSELYTAVAASADGTKLVAVNGRPVLSTDGIRRYGMKAFPKFTHPTGGLNMNLDELVRWERALAAGKVISKKSLADMSTAPVLDGGKQGAFGLSFLIGQLGAYKTVSSGGGAAVWCLRIPEKQLTVLVLSNLQGSFPEKLAARIAEQYLAR